MPILTEYTRKIIQHSDLSEDEMTTCMRHIMAGETEDIELAAFLTALAQKGETVDEIVGAVKVLREKARTVNAPQGAVDCCGTGGDGLGTYNVSTAVAIVCAACGVPMAKHGNRSASSKSGAADVLEALGANLDMSDSKLEEALRRFYFAFLMAPHHHQAMKHVIPVRKALGFRTIFNLLGPLLNPAETQYQLIGVYSDHLLLPMAETLSRLGTKKAWIVHGDDGMDEISICAPTRVAILNHGTIEETVVTPEDCGLARTTPNELSGGAAQENAAALKDLLTGTQGAYRDIVLANASAVLMIAGKADSLRQGAAYAADAIDCGAAMHILESYIAFSQEGATQKDTMEA